MLSIMNFDPEKHKRTSLRLKGYDYAQDGMYFITICVKDKICSFGKIDNHVMILSAIGEMAKQYWLDIPKHFAHAVMHDYVIMPNHVHGIVELQSVGTSHDGSVGTSHGMSLQHGTPPHGTSHGMSLQREFAKPIAGSISTIINQYKSSVKRWCNKNNFVNFQWQSRFFDHIIRSDSDFYRISDYINNNPNKWIEDNFYQITLNHDSI